KAAAAARSHQELINRLSFSGDADNNLPGLLNNPNIPAVTILADGTGSSKTFASKTADKIVRDVNQLINSIVIVTKGTHRATDVWMPIEQFALISSTQNSSASDTTILKFLQDVNPGVTFRAIVELDGAGAAGADRMYAMENSIDNWQVNIPMMMKTYSPQQSGLEFVIPMESRFGGVTIEYPLAFAYSDGI
ncbi:MAG: major capsid family protein, partial [Shewanella oncorhynchi]